MSSHGIKFLHITININFWTKPNNLISNVRYSPTWNFLKNSSHPQLWIKISLESLEKSILEVSSSPIHLVHWQSIVVGVYIYIHTVGLESRVRVSSWLYESKNDKKLLEARRFIFIPVASASLNANANRFLVQLHSPPAHSVYLIRIIEWPR